MPDLTLLALFNFRRYRGRHRRVFVVLDRARSGPPAEFLRAVRPWSSWMTVAGIVEVAEFVHQPLGVERPALAVA